MTIKRVVGWIGEVDPPFWEMHTFNIETSIHDFLVSAVNPILELGI
jgi:hypothetical protein